MLRKTDKMAFKMTTVSKAKRKLQRFRSLLAGNKRETHLKNDPFIKDNLHMNNCVNKVYNKEVMVTNTKYDDNTTSKELSYVKVQVIDHTSAKFELLKRIHSPLEQEVTVQKIQTYQRVSITLLVLMWNP